MTSTETVPQPESQPSLPPEVTLQEAHLFKVEGRKFVFAIENFAIFEVDDVIWDLFCMAERPDAPPPAEWLANLHGEEVAAEVLAELRELELLRPAGSPSTAAPPPKVGVKGITLNLVHGCNLRCTYCFAQQGDYGLGRSRMDTQMARKAIDWLAERTDAPARVGIEFFGGEPMLNMRTLRSAVAYAAERLGRDGKEAHYHITTNGTRLDEENVDFIARQKNMTVQVSLDGIPEVNDRFRIFPDGRGSHRVVTEGVGRLKAATGKAVLRATILPGYTKFGDSLRHMMEDLGASAVAVEPASGSVAGRAIDREEMAKIKAEWERVAQSFAEHGEHGQIQPIANLLKVLFKLHRHRKTVYFCAAGRSHLAIDTQGDIYPCHRFIGETGWKMGNVREGDLDPDLCERFEANSVHYRDACRNCWARYMCGGLCAHEALKATGTITEPDPVRCDLMRHMTELALQLYVRLKPHEEKLAAAAAVLEGR